MKLDIKMSVVMAALLLSTYKVNANVRYDFTALSSLPFEGYSYTGSFSVVVPSFISSFTTIPVSTLLHCSALTSSGSINCFDPSFEFFQVGYDAIGFGVHAIVAPGESPNLRNYYYFKGGAFSTPGAYSSFFGADQAGTLVVSVVPTVSEPAAGTLAILGVAAVLTVIRKQGARSRQSAHAA